MVIFCLWTTLICIYVSQATNKLVEVNETIIFFLNTDIAAIRLLWVDNFIIIIIIKKSKYCAAILRDALGLLISITFFFSCVYRCFFTLFRFSFVASGDRQPQGIIFSHNFFFSYKILMHHLVFQSLSSVHDLLIFFLLLPFFIVLSVDFLFRFMVSATILLSIIVFFGFDPEIELVTKNELIA